MRLVSFWVMAVGLVSIWAAVAVTSTKHWRAVRQIDGWAIKIRDIRHVEMQGIHYSGQFLRGVDILVTGVMVGSVVAPPAAAAIPVLRVVAQTVKMAQNGFVKGARASEAGFKVLAITSGVVVKAEKLYWKDCGMGAISKIPLGLCPDPLLSVPSSFVEIRKIGYPWCRALSSDLEFKTVYPVLKEDCV